MIKKVILKEGKNNKEIKLNKEIDIKEILYYTYSKLKESNLFLEILNIDKKVLFNKTRDDIIFGGGFINKEKIIFLLKQKKDDSTRIFLLIYNILGKENNTLEIEQVFYGAILNLSENQINYIESFNGFNISIDILENNALEIFFGIRKSSFSFKDKDGYYIVFLVNLNKGRILGKALGKYSKNIRYDYVNNFFLYYDITNISEGINIIINEDINDIDVENIISYIFENRLYITNITFNYKNISILIKKNNGKEKLYKRVILDIINTKEKKSDNKSDSINNINDNTNNEDLNTISIDTIDF